MSTYSLQKKSLIIVSLMPMYIIFKCVLTVSLMFTYDILIPTYIILSPIHREWDIWVLHQNQGGVRDHLKVGGKPSFTIKSIDIYVLLCCCSKGKRIKKRMTKIEMRHFQWNGTFSVKWPNKEIAHSLWIGGSISLMPTK